MPPGVNVVCYGTIFETSTSKPCCIDISNKHELLRLREQLAISDTYSILDLSNGVIHNSQNEQVARIDHVTYSVFKKLPTGTKIEVVVDRLLPLELEEIRRVPVGVNIYGTNHDGGKIEELLRGDGLFLQHPDAISKGYRYWNPGYYGDVNQSHIGVGKEFMQGMNVIFLIIENLCRSDEEVKELRHLIRTGNEVSKKVGANRQKALEMAREIGGGLVDLNKFEAIISE